LVVWLFDNLSGTITSVCSYAGTDVVTQLVLVTGCLDQPSFLISGHVRYAYGMSPNAQNPSGTEIPIGMVAVAMAAGSVNGECFVAPPQDPPGTSTAYSCRVRRGTSGWTGTTELTSPLPLDLLDVCRYVSDAPGNAGHPQVYVNLDRSLSDQNFLVVDQHAAAPAGAVDLRAAAVRALGRVPRGEGARELCGHRGHGYISHGPRRIARFP
jgi:hypothetical protein